MNSKRQPAKKQKSAPGGSSAVDAYLSSVSPEACAGLMELREAIMAVLPNAEQGISYGIPAFRVNGRPVVWFAAFKDHSSFFPAAAAIRVHAAALKGYKISKGTIQFPHREPPPAKLVAKLVKTRLAELEGPKGRRRGKSD